MKKYSNPISCSLLMVVTSNDLYIAMYTIQSLKKIINIENLIVKIFANGLNENQENKICSLISRWENVDLESNREYINNNKKQIESQIGKSFYDEKGRLQLRQGLCEPGPSIWERELIKFDTQLVGIIDADFEILDARYFINMLNEMNQNSKIGIFSTDYTETKDYYNYYTTLDNTYSDPKTVLMGRYHTWFCLYERNLLNIDSNFSYIEEERDKLLYTYDHSAKLQEKLINEFGLQAKYSTPNYKWCYLHYGAFAKNKTLKGLNLFLYRIFRIGIHNGFKHIINVPSINRKIYWISKRVFSIFNLNRYDSERLKFSWQ